MERWVSVGPVPWCRGIWNGGDGGVPVAPGGTFLGGEADGCVAGPVLGASLANRVMMAMTSPRGRGRGVAAPADDVRLGSR